MSLAWMPKGVLEKIRRISFKFLWAGTHEQFVLSWVRCELLAVPKALGGWDLKNIFLFSKALAAKSGWKLITSENLWTNVVVQKYIQPDTIEEWIRREENDTINCSIIWKEVLKSFPVFEEGLAWKVGNGTKIQIGNDPWPGSGVSHLLPNELIRQLHANRLYYINHIADQVRTTIWSQEWKDYKQAGLDKAFSVQCTAYTRALKAAHILSKFWKGKMNWSDNMHPIVATLPS